MARSSTNTIEYSMKNLAIWWPPIIVILGVILYYFVTVNYYNLPTPLTYADEATKPNRFIAESAQRINIELAKLGPRPTGSETNEVHAVAFLLNELSKIRAVANSNHVIECEVQESAGSTDYVTFTSVYRGIHNVVVKFTPRFANPDSAILLNSHFDTVPTSPGAGDDGIMVSVMLEVLRILSQSDAVYKHSFIFLFNGAEEVGLIGSAAFIKHHRWAAAVQAVVNLDAGGNSGRERLFRSSTSSPWLIDLYSRSVPHPLAVITSQEMFYLIPSDTDFRVFHEFSGIQGVDLALSHNGYVYHNKYDVPDSIPLGTYQHTGDNILALAIAFAQSEEVSNKNKVSRHDELVYFDYLGWFIISYTVTVAIVINVVIFLVLTALLLFTINQFSNHSGFTFWRILTEFGIVLLVQLFTVMFAIGILLALCLIYDAVNRSMSWYSNPWLLFGMYLCPLWFGLTLGPIDFLAIRKKFLNLNYVEYSPIIPLNYQIQMFVHAQCFLVALVAMILSGIYMKSGFLATFCVIFYCIALFANILFKCIHHDRSWMIAITIGQIIPFIYYAHLSFIQLAAYIPIQGRFGPHINPEYFIGTMVCITGLLQSGLIAPMFCMCKKPVYVLYGYLFLFVLFLLLMVTPLGFPYKEAVTPQRISLHHTERIYHNYNQTERKRESGILIRHNDRHKTDFLYDQVPGLLKAINADSDCAELQCGIPITNLNEIIASKYNYWIPFSQPYFEFVTNIKFINMEQFNENIRRYHFEITGPSRISFLVCPAHGIHLTNWSISTIPQSSNYKWNNRITYFVKISSSYNSGPYHFSIDFKATGENFPDSVVDMSISGHHIHHDEIHSADFKEFIESFPKWATINSFISSYKNWKF